MIEAPVLVKARIGQGCNTCLDGVPITVVLTFHGGVTHRHQLCLQCTLLWFPGKTVDWWEERHTPYEDPRTGIRKRNQERIDAWFAEEQRQGRGPRVAVQKK